MHDWWETEFTDNQPGYIAGKQFICTDDGITWWEFANAEFAIFIFKYGIPFFYLLGWFLIIAVPTFYLARYLITSPDQPPQAGPVPADSSHGCDDPGARKAR